MKLTRAYLSELGWVDKGDIMVRFTRPRLGWKDDGTLIVGYHELPVIVNTVESFELILGWLHL